MPASRQNLAARHCARRSRPATVSVSEAVKALAYSFVVSLAVALAGCSAGDPKACTVTCSDLGQCPSGTSCGTDGYCYEPEQEPGSCSEGPPDAAPEPDGPIDQPDADPDEPDADTRIDACAGPDSFAGTNELSLSIPDDNDVGVSSTIESNAVCGVVETVQIRVEIFHTFRGDLRIELIAPGGAVARVLTESSDPGEDVFQTFDVVIAGGESASGEWVLNVSDRAGSDLGSLDRWTLGINEPAPP